MAKSFNGERSLTQELDYKTDAKSRARTAVLDKTYTWVPPHSKTQTVLSPPLLRWAALTTIRHTLQSSWNLAKAACLE